MESRQGQRLGNYQLTRLLGSGGFGEVYLAEHVYIKTLAAIKIMHANMVRGEFEQFAREAQTLASLRHPNIIRILDFGVTDNTAYLAMEYAPNGSLQEKFPRGQQVPLPMIVPYVTQVASALQYAHDRKIIHRDVKPSNMLLSEDNEVLLSDFGIAVGGYDTVSRPYQTIVGTPVYMAPEQIGGSPGRASDQYELGMVVYEWLSGTTPFKGRYDELFVQHLNALPPPLSDYLPISAEVERVVLKALAKDPHDRFATIQEFAAAFEEAARYSTTPAAAQPPAITVPPFRAVGNTDSGAFPPPSPDVPEKTPYAGSANNTATSQRDDAPKVGAFPSGQIPPRTAPGEQESILKDIEKRAQELVQNTMPFVKNVGLRGLEFLKKLRGEQQVQDTPAVSTEPTFPAEPAFPTEPADQPVYDASRSTAMFESSRLPPDQLKDFFISYHKKDQQWARWLAWQLKQHSHTYVLPVYSFHLGSSFAQEMYKATAKAVRVIVLLSPDYFEALGNESLPTVLANYNMQEQNTILPVCIRECDDKAKKSLELIDHLDLVGLNADEAKEMLLAAAQGEHIDITESPLFPADTIFLADEHEVPVTTSATSSGKTSGLSSPENSKKIEIFFSYSHYDEKFRDQLDRHLSTLKKQGLFTWYDRQIAPGQLWNAAIDAHLDTASIILLLISPNFMGSEYCYTTEMTKALARHEAGQARVIPIILSPTDLTGTSFAKLQALPKNAKPITKWTKREDAYYDVVMGIRRAIKEMFPDLLGA